MTAKRCRLKSHNIVLNVQKLEGTSLDSSRVHIDGFCTIVNAARRASVQDVLT